MEPNTASLRHRDRSVLLTGKRPFNILHLPRSFPSLQPVRKPDRAQSHLLEVLRELDTFEKDDAG